MMDSYSYQEAAKFVGTNFTSGLSQFALLSRHGLLPEHNVLEIGCGALHTARVLLPSLLPEHYCGIDPNEWLRKAAINENYITKHLCEEYKPLFDSNPNFDGTVFNRKFDRIISHSILSHAAHWQLSAFLKGVANVLTADGVAVVSIRIGDNNSMAEKWTYPDAVFFTDSAVMLTADFEGLIAERRIDYRLWHQSNCPNEIHDWYTFKLKGGT